MNVNQELDLENNISSYRSTDRVGPDSLEPLHVLRTQLDSPETISELLEVDNKTAVAISTLIDQVKLATTKSEITSLARTATEEANLRSVVPSIRLMRPYMSGDADSALAYLDNLISCPISDCWESLPTTRLTDHDQAFLATKNHRLLRKSLDNWSNQLQASLVRLESKVDAMSVNEAPSVKE